MNRRRKWLLAAAVAAFAVIVILGPYLAAARAAQNSKELSTVRQIESIIQRDTSPAAQHRQAAQLAFLIHCLFDRIDYDTGHAKHLDPVCKAVALPPPSAPSGVRAAPSTTTAVTVSVSVLPPSTDRSTVAGAAAQTVSPYPFTFAFSFDPVDHHQTTIACTITGPTGGICSTK